MIKALVFTVKNNEYLKFPPQIFQNGRGSNNLLVPRRAQSTLPNLDVLQKVTVNNTPQMYSREKKYKKTQ